MGILTKSLMTKPKQDFYKISKPSTVGINFNTRNILFDGAINLYKFDSVIVLPNIAKLSKFNEPLYYLPWKIGEI